MKKLIFTILLFLIFTVDSYADRISNTQNSVSDTTYGISWNGVTTIAPSKNAIYDKIELLGGDITDVWNCSSGDCKTLTIGEGEYLIGGAVDGTTDPYISLPQGTDCSSVIGEGYACWDTDGDIFYIGDNAAAQQIIGKKEIDTSSELADILGDETGSGVVVFGTSPTITTSIDLPAGAINTATEIGADIITHTQMLDSDQADTKCYGVSRSTGLLATDDRQSIWANKTANDFLITEIWGESDQTVSFDLQVDDGSPADVSETDIAPAAGEAEDLSLDGDTTLAAGEELDLAITSVSGTPTWFTVCWTGNWKD